MIRDEWKKLVDLERSFAEDAKPSVDNDDVVNEPEHYARWKIEPITYIMRNGFEFWRGNIIKYVSRSGSKVYDNQTQVQSEITDLRKAMRYCEMRINSLEGRDL